MTPIIKGIAAFIYRHHRLILSASVISAILSTLLILNIKLKTDPMDLLPQDNPSMNLFVEVMNDFGRMNSLIIVLQADDSHIERDTSLVEELGRRLGRSPLIRDVDYSVLNLPWDFMLKYFPIYLNDRGIGILKKKLTPEGIKMQIRDNYRRLASPFSSITDFSMISDDPLNIRALLLSTFSRNKLSEMDFSSGYYLSRDHSFALILVTPDGSSRDIGFVKLLKKEVESIASDTINKHGAGDRIKASYTGSYALAWETRESLARDIPLRAVITFVLISAVILFFYRGSIITLPVILFTLSTAILWTMAAAYIVFGGLNIITAVAAAMLLGLGIDYALHIYDRYSTEFKKHGDPELALQKTITTTGKSVITGGITTAGAFFSIIFTDFRGLHELGIVAGLGIISCMVSTIFVMGSTLIWISKTRSNFILNHKDNTFLEKTLYNYITRKGRFLLILLCLLSVVSLPGLGMIRFVSDLSSIGLKDSRAMNLQKKLSKSLPGGTAPIIITGSDGKHIDRVFDRLERLIESWKKKGIIGGHISPGNLLPPPYKQKAVMARLSDTARHKKKLIKYFVSALDAYNFRITEKDMSYINNIIDAVHLDTPATLDELTESGNKKIRAFYNPGKKRLAAYIYPANKRWNDSDISTIKEDISSMGNGWRVTGWPLFSKELKNNIIRQSMIAAFLSFGFIFAIIYLHFRKISLVFLALLPLLLGFLITAGIMGYLKIGFNYVNVAAIALMFGIAVDYGVYLIQAFIEDGSRDNTLVRHAFKNILICSLTTIVGFGSLIFTSFRGISSLGTVIVIGVISCLITSTALIPVLAKLPGFHDEKV